MSSNFRTTIVKFTILTQFSLLQLQIMAEQKGELFGDILKPKAHTNYLVTIKKCEILFNTSAKGLQASLELYVQNYKEQGAAFKRITTPNKDIINLFKKDHIYGRVIEIRNPDIVESKDDRFKQSDIRLKSTDDIHFRDDIEPDMPLLINDFQNLTILKTGTQINFRSFSVNWGSRIFTTVKSVFYRFIENI